MRVRLRDFNVPGRSRQIAVGGIIIITIISCVYVVWKSGTRDLSLAFIVLLISSIGFCLVATISYDCVRAWRMVDIPWVLASFVGIVVGLWSISDLQNTKLRSGSVAPMIRAYVELISASEIVLVTDCARSIRRPDNEEACGWLDEHVPMMRVDLENLRQAPGWELVSNWGANLPKSDANASWVWQQLGRVAEKFQSEIKRYRRTAEDNGSIKGLSSGNREGDLAIFTYNNKPILPVQLLPWLSLWYCMMSFFVGLRVSKSIADVLQSFASPSQRV
jgi:hypothetical protein